MEMSDGDDFDSAPEPCQLSSPAPATSRWSVWAGQPASVLVTGRVAIVRDSSDAASARLWTGPSQAGPVSIVHDGERVRREHQPRRGISGEGFRGPPRSIAGRPRPRRQEEARDGQARRGSLET